MKTHPLSAGHSESNGEAGAMTNAEGGRVGAEGGGGGAVGGDAMLVRRAEGQRQENAAEGARPVAAAMAMAMAPAGAVVAAALESRFAAVSAAGAMTLAVAAAQRRKHAMLKVKEEFDVKSEEFVSGEFYGAFNKAGEKKGRSR